MEFKNQKPIYLQIADHICNRILLGEYGEDERLPSVREFAAEVEVNVNTVTRTFEYLQQNEVVASRRGLGVFVMPGHAKGFMPCAVQSSSKYSCPRSLP